MFKKFIKNIKKQDEKVVKKEIKTDVSIPLNSVQKPTQPTQPPQPSIPEPPVDK